MEVDSCLWSSQTNDKTMTYEIVPSFVQAWCAIHEVEENMQDMRTHSSSAISLNTSSLMTYTLLTFQMIYALQDPMHSRPAVVDRLWSNEDACNTTLYVNWYQSPYAGELVEEYNNLWLPSDAGLTNGQAMEIVSAVCLLMMRTVHNNRAGRHGPSPDRYIYDVMCSEECTFSDSLREEVMVLTRCNCLQLSTMPTDPVYHIIGDWCRTNSGRYEFLLLDLFRFSPRPLLHTYRVPLRQLLLRRSMA